MIEEEKLYREAEAAKTLDLSVFTLRNWRVQGKGPEFLRLHRSIRYTGEQLRDFIEKSKARLK